MKQKGRLRVRTVGRMSAHLVWANTVLCPRHERRRPHPARGASLPRGHMVSAWPHQHSLCRTSEALEPRPRAGERVLRGVSSEEDHPQRRGVCSERGEETSPVCWPLFARPRYREEACSLNLIFVSGKWRNVVCITQSLGNVLRDISGMGKVQHRLEPKRPHD